VFGLPLPFCLNDFKSVRLSSIKLSGFKSFAEPTNFMLPGQLVGVVGPNGCGKSNIMDAVRWVLGESKASELRGESMQDVIFNGTTSRKPAGRASVELAFDNDDHRGGGQWSQFAEIAVKRVLTRDGTSSYYINNQPVRRRDVQDVFLGTGLGPRAYAIIGQGTISRIIESRPEELRLFLEEAAGVSKYKERRRETESRLHDTRENLTRVQDILRELNANLTRLEQQAEVAQKFKNLSEASTVKQNQLWFLKQAEAQSEQRRVQEQALQAQNALDARLADLRRVEAELEAVRQAHYAAGDLVNRAQGRLYEASAEVGRLEAEIRYLIEARQRVQARCLALQGQAAHCQSRSQDAQLELDQLGERSLLAQGQCATLLAQLEQQTLQLPQFEQETRSAQRDAGEQRSQVTALQQQLGVLAAEQRSLHEQSRQLELRSERLQRDQQGLHSPDASQMLQQQELLTQAQQADETAQACVNELQDRIPELDEQRRRSQLDSTAESSRLAELRARLEALKALQDRVKTDGKLLPWLQRHGLDHLPALWTRVQVEPGWEAALEAALRERLGAIEVSRLDLMATFAHDAPPTKLGFFNAMAGLTAGGEQSLLRPMLQLLRQSDAGLQAVLADWLQGVFVADTLEQALAVRQQLQAGDRVYVAAGHSVGRHSVSFYAPDTEQSGLLARAHEIDNLEKQVRAQTLMAEQARAELLRVEAAWSDASQRLVQARRHASQTQSQSHALQVETMRLTQVLEQSRQRSQQIASDRLELQAMQDDLQQRRAQAEARFEELDLQLADSQERHALLEDRVLAAERLLAQGREQQRALERTQQEAEFAQRSLAARRAELTRAIESAADQASQISAELEKSDQELTQLSEASAQAGLQHALAVRLDCEQHLAAQRSQYDDLTQKLRASDEQRLLCERDLDPLRSRITELQLKEQAARLGFEQYHQLLLDAQADLPALAASMAQAELRLAGLQAEIDRINRDIAALGAVNLAALDELVLARERKEFLDSQSADLQEAMGTLEDAIRRIDGETRELLSGTFQTVNQHFGAMFPKLFGGGNARLVVTGAEILDSGVQVIAQPPGKKNQSIALLSGGEKALTAIALVFAIFQLNPAPFCLLDEVDAPLDDANTQRYAQLVTSMSRETQFLFISHNKIAMEMAEQLIGVTMQEQGVSRIVAVDMDAALNLADQLV